MRTFFVFLAITYSTAVLSQESSFYKAELTNKSSESETVYFKKKEYVIDNEGIINIYASPNKESKMQVSANDFSKIEATDSRIVLITARIPQLDAIADIVLRKLVDGANSLFVHTHKSGEETFINESNGEYTILGDNIVDKLEVYFKKWLFEHLNPENHKISFYNKMKYNAQDLADYYINNQVNAVELDQEEQVQTLKLNLNAGVMFNSVSGTLIEPGSGNSFRIGIQGVINLDRVTNRHTVITGLSYQSGISASGVVNINPESMNSQLNRIVETEMALDFLTFHVGYQYNFHFNQLSVSPFASVGPGFHMSGSIVESVFQDDGEQFFLTEAHTTNPISYNLGLKLSFKDKYFVLLEYNYMNDIIFQRLLSTGNVDLISYELSSFYVGIGYTFL